MQNKGQSIIEVMFAVGLVSLLVGAVATLSIASFKSKTQGVDRKVALDLLEKKVESLVSLSVSDPVMFWGKIGGVSDSERSGGYSMETKYEWDNVACTGNRCGKVTVTVTFDKGSGETVVKMEKKFVKGVLLLTPTPK